MHVSTISILLGAAYYYTLLLLSTLWLFHSAILSWGVLRPYHYSSTRSSGKIKYVHICVVVIAVTVPAIMAVALQFSGGYGHNIFLFPRCGLVKNKDIFYGLIIPVDVIVIIGITLMLLTNRRIADFVSHPCQSLFPRCFMHIYFIPRNTGAARKTKIDID